MWFREVRGSLLACDAAPRLRAVPGLSAKAFVLRDDLLLVSYRPLARGSRRSCRLPHEGVVRVCHIYSSLLLGGPARRLFLFQRSSGSVPRQRLAHNALARRSSARTRRRGAGPAPRRTAGRAPGPLVRRVVDPPRADAARNASTPSAVVRPPAYVVEAPGPRRVGPQIALRKRESAASSTRSAPTPRGTPRLPVISIGKVIPGNYR